MFETLPTWALRVGLMALALSGCGGKSAPPEAATGPAQQEALPERPRLVVWIVVDQLPERLLDRARPHVVGGLARLLGPEAWTGVAEYAHASTLTGPGHATLATGASPSVHGIVSNHWYQGEESYNCADLDLLLAEPAADRVAAAGGRVVALSHKDRGAVFLGGGHARAVVQYDKDSGRFVGAPWADLDLEPLRAEPWQPAHPELYASFGPDDREVERGPDGATFPHDIRDPGHFLYSTAAGTALVNAAIAGVDAEELGRDEIPDLLTLSFSHTDYVGHAYTSESWEALDALLGVDRDLGRLFDHLDQVVGEGRWTAVLSSDHGAAPDVSRRIEPSAVLALGEAALSALGHEGSLRAFEPYVALPSTITDPDARLTAAQAVAEAMAQAEGVAAAWAWRAGLPESVPHGAAVLEAIHPERAGDVYLYLEEETLFTFRGHPTGTSHGSPWSYDRRVPLLLVGAGIQPGEGTEPVDVRQVAPTVAALLGVPPPAQAEQPPVWAACPRACGGK